MRPSVPVQRRRADLRALAPLSITVRCNRLLGGWDNVVPRFTLRLAVRPQRLRELRGLFLVAADTTTKS